MARCRNFHHGDQKENAKIGLPEDGLFLMDDFMPFSHLLMQLYYCSLVLTQWVFIIIIILFQTECYPSMVESGREIDGNIFNLAIASHMFVVSRIRMRLLQNQESHVRGWSAFSSAMDTQL